jgi:hypothetical protein
VDANPRHQRGRPWGDANLPTRQKLRGCRGGAKGLASASSLPRLRFAHGCWLRPHQDQGQGKGAEQREEEQGGSIWREFDFFVNLGKLPRCKLPCKMQALKPSNHMLVGRPGQEGASCWGG